MKKTISSIILIFVGLVFLSSDAFSAWTQPKNHAYNQLSLSHYRTDKKFKSFDTDSEGEITNINGLTHRESSEEFNSTKITYYSEYGITDKITVFTTIPWDWQRSNDTKRYANEDGPSGIGDINLGLRHALINNILGTGVLMSIQGTVKIPEAYDYKDPLQYLSLGDGQYDTTVALLFGRGLGKGYAWLNAGYKFRFENTQIDDRHFKPSDQIKVSMGGGYSVTSWLSIRGLLEWTKSIGNANVSNELEVANYAFGGNPDHRDVIIIKDTLGLEPNILSYGVDLAFNVSKVLPIMKNKFPSKEIVFSYNSDLTGFGDFRTKDYALGETLTVAFVFPAEGLFPFNMFTK